MTFKTITIGLLSLSLAIVAFALVKKGIPTQGSETVLVETKDSKQESTTLSESKSDKLATLKLGKRNTVSLRGVVTEETVTEVEQELLTMSAKLDADDEIYLVLDTPGGSIDAGNNLIEFIKGLPQKVNTVSLFSASMGFHIVQSLNKRYVTSTATLMSHRAKAQVGGEIPGSLISRINSLSKLLDIMDQTAADRMQISRNDYRDVIHDELWINGKENIEAKTADQVVKVSCAKDLSGEKSIVFNTIFGDATVVFSQCPIITSPLKVIFGVGQDKNDKLRNFVGQLFYNKKRFVQEFILTNKYEGILK